MENIDEIGFVAAKSFEINSNNYLIVDFLNKSLKSHNLIFGLTRNGDNEVITIYNTNTAGSSEK